MAGIDFPVVPAEKIRAALAADDFDAAVVLMQIFEAEVAAAAEIPELATNTAAWPRIHAELEELRTEASQRRTQVQVALDNLIRHKRGTQAYRHQMGTP